MKISAGQNFNLFKCNVSFVGKECLSGTQLVGTDTICPGETGFYRCVNTDLFQQTWAIDGVRDPFPEDDTVGDSITSIPGAIGYLLERTVKQNGRGNRTSVMVYTPDADATSGEIRVQCSAGGVPCIHVTSLIGMV